MTIIAGNWKMNHDPDSSLAFFEKLKSYGSIPDNVKTVIFPTFLCLNSTQTNSLGVEIGAQNGNPEKSGALTGEVSIFDFPKVNVNWLLVGHSERRHVFKEGSEFLKKKVETALSLGIKTVYCVGETIEDKEKGLTGEVLKKQISYLGDFLSDENLIIAYEPVWAIGSGMPAGSKDADEASLLCKDFCKRDIDVLYGGSVNSQNVSNYLSSGLISGFLIGGASLNADSYRALIDAVA